MTVMIDILGALVLAGIMFLTIFGLMVNMNQATFDKTMNVNIQANIINIGRILETDFLKMGYHIKNDAIQYADSTSIKFKGDLQNNNTIQAVEYVMGSSDTTTKNPNDRILTRIVSGQQTINACIGMTYLHFAYYDTTGRELKVPISTAIRLDSIKAIRVKIRLESVEPVSASYSLMPSYQGVFWEKTLYPRNL